MTRWPRVASTWRTPPAPPNGCAYSRSASCRRRPPPPSRYGQNVAVEGHHALQSRCSAAPPKPGIEAVGVAGAERDSIGDDWMPGSSMPAAAHRRLDALGRPIRIAVPRPLPCIGDGGADDLLPRPRRRRWSSGSRGPPTRALDDASPSGSSRAESAAVAASRSAMGLWATPESIAALGDRHRNAADEARVERHRHDVARHRPDAAPHRWRFVRHVLAGQRGDRLAAAIFISLVDGRGASSAPRKM